MTGIVPSEEFNEQIKRTVRETIRRQRPNVGGQGRWHKKGGSGGGGHVMHYTVEDCDDEIYYVTPTHWTGGCGDPPGQDDYTGFWIVERMPCSAPWTVDQMETGDVSGVAAYTYPQDGECLPIWMEINSCGPLDC